jgi:uncharacterized protein (DUF2062 family)
MPDATNPPTLTPTERKGLLARFRQHILHPEMTPHQVALSFAVGFSMAWNPILGIHTAAILALCLMFRKLHRPLMLISCYINNPWTMVPMATVSALFGNVLLGRGWHLNLRGIHWKTIGWRSFATREGFDSMMAMCKPILVPYLLGGIVLSILALPVGYYLMLKIAQRLRRLHIHLPHLTLPKPHEPK